MSSSLSQPARPIEAASMASIGNLKIVVRFIAQSSVDWRCIVRMSPGEWISALFQIVSVCNWRGFAACQTGFYGYHVHHDQGVAYG
jgi:hypothetical protein